MLRCFSDDAKLPVWVKVPLHTSLFFFALWAQTGGFDIKGAVCKSDDESFFCHCCFSLKLQFKKNKTNIIWKRHGKLFTKWSPRPVQIASVVTLSTCFGDRTGRTGHFFFFFLFRRLLFSTDALLLLPSVRQCLNDGIKVVIPERAELVLLNALDHKKKNSSQLCCSGNDFSNLCWCIFKMQNGWRFIPPETSKTH